MPLRSTPPTLTATRIPSQLPRMLHFYPSSSTEQLYPPTSLPIVSLATLLSNITTPSFKTCLDSKN